MAERKWLSGPGTASGGGPRHAGSAGHDGAHRDANGRAHRDANGHAGGAWGALGPAHDGILGRMWGCRVAVWLPALLIVVGVLVNLFGGYGLTGAPFFSAAALVAAPFCSTRATAGIGLVAVVSLALLNVYVDVHSSGLADFSRTFTLGVVALLAIGINRLLQRSGAALASARVIAEAAQFAVLPLPPARIGGLQVAARYRAAQTGARIGGDLYAVQDTPYGVRLLVGDVRGKGLDAIEAVVIVIGAFREAAEQEVTLEAVAERLERALHREGRRRRGLDDYEGFTTAALAEVPADAPGLVRIVNRGHPPPLLIHDGSGGYCRPSNPALPLGMPELGHWPDRADEFDFPLGSQLLVYTDGLSEARDAADRFYDPHDRLVGRRFEEPEALLDAVLTDVEAHTGGRMADDMALLAVQRRPGAE